MSQTGISWGFGEVVSTKNAFNQKTDREEKKKRNSEGKAVGEDIADPKYRGEIEVTMQANQGGIPGGLSGDTITAYPADLNYTRIPLVGEHVIMYQGPAAGMGASPPDTKTGDKKAGVGFDTEWFYLPPITLRGNVEANLNPMANAGGIGGSNQTIQDGQQKKKSDAYANVESGNPSVVNKKPGNSSINSSARNINTFPDYSKGELSDKDIAEFQELEQKILDMNNPESPTYQRVYYNADSESEAEGRVEDQIDKYEKKIERFKEDLRERGFIGDFVESEGDIDTVTGYLGLVPEQEQAKKDEAAERQRQIQGNNPNPNTSKQTGGGGGGRNQNKLTTPPGNDFVEKGNIGNLQPYEGDFLLQGRMVKVLDLDHKHHLPIHPHMYNLSHGKKEMHLKAHLLQ